MGQTVKTGIEINAPPAVVQKTFLDFASYPTWSHWTIVGRDNAGLNGEALKSGDVVDVKMGGGMGFAPVIQDNREGHFSWLGSLPYIFTGKHRFYFRPSEKNPGGTLFRQEETFTGALSFMMRKGSSLQQSTVAGWERFDKDLRKEAEKRARQ